MKLVSTHTPAPSRAHFVLGVSLLLFSFSSFNSFAKDILTPVDFPKATNPLLHTQLQVVTKQSMAIACNPHHRIASWVMFELTQQDLDLKPRLKRITSNYPSDTLMTGPCVVGNNEYKDYTAAGYDRGHLADAESFSGSPVSNNEVASTSNLSPQDKSFNRGIWAKLEAWQRSQALIEKDIVVYVGPVLKDQLPALAAGISIPEKFYKIIVDKTPPMKAIAFIIDQDDRGNFKEHWVCAEEVEKQTGLSFADDLLGSDKISLFKNCHLNEWQ
jgi:endonuclease G